MKFLNSVHYPTLLAIRHSLNSKKGFSLLELLIYVAILSVVTLSVAGIFVYINKGRGQTESKAEVNSNLRFAIEKISQDLRYATSVTTPANPSSTSTSLILNSGGSTITYCIAIGFLRRQVGGACDQNSESITSDSVIMSDALFTRLENINNIFNKTIVSIRINITAAYNSSSPDYEYSETKNTTVSLR